MPQDARTLQQQLDALLRIAKSNERKQDNFQQYELSLLNSNGLEELLSLILEQHQHRFQLTEVTLLLHDPEYAFQRLVEALPKFSQWQHKLLFTDALYGVDQFFSLQRNPRLGLYSAQKHQPLFPAFDSLGSVALLPLIRQNKLIGSLNLASRNPDRFQAGIGTQFLQHLAAVVSACIENARLHEEIKLVGLCDPLTGVNNRRFFDQRIEEEFSKAQRNQSTLACLFIDLDHFKRINDTHGHQVGDVVLKHVAQLLSETLRQGDVLARYGGEEFVVLLTGADQIITLEIAERMRNLVENTPFWTAQNKSVQVTLSVGIAFFQAGQVISVKQLLQKADQAVYAAKLSGRNQIKISTDV